MPPDSEAVGQAIGLFGPGDDAPVRIPRHPNRPSRLIFLGLFHRIMTIPQELSFFRNNDNLQQDTLPGVA